MERNATNDGSGDNLKCRPEISEQQQQQQRHQKKALPILMHTSMHSAHFKPSSQSLDLHFFSTTCSFHFFVYSVCQSIPFFFFFSVVVRVSSLDVALGSEAFVARVTNLLQNSTLARVPRPMDSFWQLWFLLNKSHSLVPNFMNLILLKRERLRLVHFSLSCFFCTFCHRSHLLRAHRTSCLANTLAPKIFFLAQTFRLQDVLRPQRLQRQLVVKYVFVKNISKLFHVRHSFKKAITELW